ncbi:CsbD family protein [Leptolyngbya cf. ectocarpi LEGE 11479]|uniref:CsbD family protein n=1 Tax=Leptolyngbya cf. ectocarpi LEGE 11479 TaxID=1828722 RepID=A0A929FCB0_LEPEC|nr:CsbD family protein [Leptolyngbya ectocarpi]MBE9069804.1 CsbD family protein [Leptolyngbya cf. ectocarpi LEGE 11479]
MPTKLFQILRQTAKALCLSLLAAVLLNVVAVPGAIALGTDSTDIAMSRAADEVDRVVGEGTSNQIEGKVQRDIGNVKQSVGKVTGQIEGATDQVKGKVKSDIGRTQAAADDAGDAAEDATEGFIDSVKDLFD